MVRQRSHSLHSAVEYDHMRSQSKIATSEQNLRAQQPRQRGSCGRMLLLFISTAHVLYGATAQRYPPPGGQTHLGFKLMSGQLTWEINPYFTTNTGDDLNVTNRTVTFTLLTAFEMDPMCDFRENVVSCPGSSANNYGFLCVDQYKMNAAGYDQEGKFVHDLIGTACSKQAGPHTGRNNTFQIISTRHINGLNIVFGRLTHTVVATKDTIAMMAYFQPIAGTISAALPQCGINFNKTYLPCVMNAFDLDPTTGIPAIDPSFKLRTTPGFFETPNGVSLFDLFNPKEHYWNSYENFFNDPKPEQAVPLFEVFVQLCATAGAHQCTQFSPADLMSIAAFASLAFTPLTSRNMTFDAGLAVRLSRVADLQSQRLLAFPTYKQEFGRIMNYYSPVPAAPAFVEVAVTSYTQRADRETLLSQQQGWFFNGSDGVTYVAPHPPFQVTSYDLDGHQMSQVSIDWGNDRGSKRSNRNLGLECFQGGQNSTKAWPFMDTEMETNDAYKHPVMRKNGACNIYFDMDRSGGSQLKFDFNFGSNRTEGRYYRKTGNYTQSVIFGNDLTRCRGDIDREMQACNPGGSGACVDPKSGRLSSCSGNLMFTQHLINTADLPWVDVDNKWGKPGAYTVPQPLWYSTFEAPGSAMVKTLVSAYMCFAGTANQPPRFMKDLEAVPNASDWMRVPGVTTANYLTPEDTEITCRAGEPCVFPIYAQDFLLDFKGRSCVNMLPNADPKLKPNEPCVFAPGEDEQARYQSSDVVRIEMAPGWESYDPIDSPDTPDADRNVSTGVDLVTAYCSIVNGKALGCVRDSDCPPGWGTCTGFLRNQYTKAFQVTPGYCINPKANEAESQDYEPARKCRTDRDCEGDSKCAIPSCESAALYPDSSTPVDGGLGALKCFYKEYFKAKDVGKVKTRCFVATDPHGDKYFNNDTLFAANPDHPRVWDGKCNDMKMKYRQGGPGMRNKAAQGIIPNPSAKGCQSTPPVHTEGDFARTCKSMPVCFKIKVEGKAPTFVEPTPREANSYDDNGNLVFGRTDVPACEGYPLQLTIRATDPDGDDVRIFVEDKDKDEAVASALDIGLLGRRYILENTQTYNLDFFTNATMPFPMGAVGSSSSSRGFQPYGAVRVGNNSLQLNILPKEYSGQYSIMTGYNSTSVKYSRTAQQSIQYRFDSIKRNGMIVRSTEANHLNDPESCMVNDQATTVDDNRCREKLLNMDQVICAFAYDNSGFKSGRWVGKTDPNGKNRQFCTENARPFGSPKDSSAKAYVAGKADAGWLAQCSAERTVPQWMRDHSNGDMVSPMHCWRIVLQAPPVFLTDPTKTSTPFPPDYNLAAFDGTMAFSSAQALAGLTPKLDVQVGYEFSYTFVAQDPNPKDVVEILIMDDPGMPPGMTASRTTCIGRDATKNSGQVKDMWMADDGGWNLPTKMKAKTSGCSKVKMTVTWIPDVESEGLQYKVCMVAKDSSEACTGIAPQSQATSRGWFGETQCLELNVVRPVISFDLGMQPELIQSYVGCTTSIKLLAIAVGSIMPYQLKIIQLKVAASPEGGYLTEPEMTNRSTTRYFRWLPRRGMEGQKYQACFTANDLDETRDNIEPVCFSMTVQKCQYCISKKETLSVMMKDYGLDTNWLRVWIHNGNGAGNLKPRVNNPDLIVDSHEVTSIQEEMGNYFGQPILWAGVMYQAGVGESLVTIAAKFRTTVSGLLSVNPDISGEGDVVPDLSSICVVPCALRNPGRGPIELEKRAAL